MFTLGDCILTLFIYSEHSLCSVLFNINVVEIQSMLNAHIYVLINVNVFLGEIMVHPAVLKSRQNKKRVS